MSEATPSSALERVKRAKLREIEAHRIELATHENTAIFFENLGLEAEAAAMRKHAEHARAMLETAIRQADAFPIDRS